MTRRENTANTILQQRHIFFSSLPELALVVYCRSDPADPVFCASDQFFATLRRLITCHCELCDRSEIIVILIYAFPSSPWIRSGGTVRNIDSATARITSGDCAKRAPASGNFRAAFMPFMREVRRTQNTRAPFPACFPRDARTRGMPRTPVKS